MACLWLEATLHHIAAAEYPLLKSLPFRGISSSANCACLILQVALVLDEMSCLNR